MTTTTTTTTMTTETTKTKTNVFQRERWITFFQGLFCYVLPKQNKTEQNRTQREAFRKISKEQKGGDSKFSIKLDICCPRGEKWFFLNSAALSSLIPLLWATRWVRISVSSVRLSNLLLRAFFLFFSHRQMLPWCDLNQELFVFWPTWIWWFKSSTIFFILHFMIFIKNIKVNCNICR